MIYHILYKNGVEDKIKIKVDESNIKKLTDMNQIIETCMREDAPGYIALGDEKTEGSFIRMSDVARIKVIYGEVDAE